MKWDKSNVYDPIDGLLVYHFVYVHEFMNLIKKNERQKIMAKICLDNDDWPIDMVCVN